MSELLLIALTAAVVSNFVLARSLAVTPRGIDAALVIGAATWLALLLALTATRALQRLVLEPLDSGHFTLLALLSACVAAASLMPFVAQRLMPRWYAVLRDHVPLVAGSSGLLGVAVERTSAGGPQWQLLAASGAGLAFAAALAMLTGLCERLERADVPTRFRGPAIVLVTAGLLSLGFIGFTGSAGF